MNTTTATINAQEIDALVRLYDILAEDIDWTLAEKNGDVDTIDAAGAVIMRLFNLQQAQK